MKKSMIAILTATIIILSSLGPLLLTTQAAAPDPASWYKTVYGNLGVSFEDIHTSDPRMALNGCCHCDADPRFDLRNNS